MSDQVSEPKKIGHEYIAGNEDAISAQMVNEFEAQLDRLYKDKKMLRQIHTKMHGCLKATFTIEPGLPNELRVGLFKYEKSFHAWVRFSSASTQPKPDKKKDVRGIAIKIMGVPGEKILNVEHLQSTQDFLLMSSETYFAKNVQELSGLLAAVTSPHKIKLIGYAINPAHWSLLKRVSQVNIALNNPVETRYWSTQPYQFGSTSAAVKYFLKPSPDNKIVIENVTDNNYLRINLAQTLNNNEANFDFFVQFQTDADTMPIEDTTIPWTSTFIKVATLKIPAQDFDSKEQMVFGENLSFNSWHALPEHRPLGSFNRVRKRVYEAMSKYRHEKNDLPVFEPQDSPDFLSGTRNAKNNTIEISVPTIGVIKETVSVLVDCTKERAYNYVSGSEQLPDWLKKSGPISGVSFVEIIKGPYTQVGAKRKVTFEDGDTVQEELISYNPYANYAYRITAFSDFLRKLTNAAYGQLWFDRIDDKTRITWMYSYTYKNTFSRIILWLFNTLLFKKFMQKGLNNVKVHIEHR
jgi:hypothetical protein